MSSSNQYISRRRPESGSESQALPLNSASPWEVTCVFSWPIYNEEWNGLTSAIKCPSLWCPLNSPYLFDHNQASLETGSFNTKALGNLLQLMSAGPRNFREFQDPSVKYRDSETPRLRMTLQEAKAIWVSFVGVLKVHNALEIKATFLKQCFPNCFLQSSRTPRGAAPHKCIAK